MIKNTSAVTSAREESVWAPRSSSSTNQHSTNEPHSALQSPLDQHKGSTTHCALTQPRNHPRTNQVDDESNATTRTLRPALTTPHRTPPPTLTPARSAVRPPPRHLPQGRCGHTDTHTHYIRHANCHDRCSSSSSATSRSNRNKQGDGQTAQGARRRSCILPA
ncbi:hypothetical protein DQ04_05691010 [Trypanosoma grayi]|uniref:hypothetical protein n=1 Tax=Trypanosoma grayi TaxID=71804 RepID=UPI0004F437D7|nr:hypothetical protein DQ04_05691010 [Trypanosoma grayi]KEG09165.1 hypothetical protein DQ04_05691010 [Trypanosoma grayi]